MTRKETKRVFCHQSLLLLGAFACCGCSFIGVTKVQPVELEAAKRRRAEDQPLEGIRTGCTSSRAAPIVDTVFGGILMVNVFTALALPEKSLEGAPGGKYGFGLGMLGASMVSFSSAAWGFDATSQCIDFKKRVSQTDDGERGEESAEQAEIRRLRERVRNLEENRR